MKVFFNGKQVDLNSIPFSEVSRGFDYGDGLFETVLVNRGIPVLLKLHLERLDLGAKILDLDRSILDAQNIQSQVHALWKKENRPHWASSKIRIWRSGGQGYGNTGLKTNILVSINTLESFRKKSIERFGVITSIQNENEVLSPFKTLNSLKYVLASQEANKNLWEEGIITDTNGLISEGLSSNIFYFRDSWKTPSLETGCVAGIMRRAIMETQLFGSPVNEEINEPPETLAKVPWFSINSLGLLYHLPKESLGQKDRLTEAIQLIEKELLIPQQLP